MSFTLVLLVIVVILIEKWGFCVTLAVQFIFRNEEDVLLEWHMIKAHSCLIYLAGGLCTNMHYEMELRMKKMVC